MVVQGGRYVIELFDRFLNVLDYSRCGVVVFFLLYEVEHRWCKVKFWWHFTNILKQIDIEGDKINNIFFRNWFWVKNEPLTTSTQIWKPIYIFRITYVVRWCFVIVELTRRRCDFTMLLISGWEGWEESVHIWQIVFGCLVDFENDSKPSKHLWRSNQWEFARLFITSRQNETTSSWNELTCLLSCSNKNSWIK